MPGDPNGDRQQQILYYEQYIKKLPGTYQGDDTRYRGKTWPEIYQLFLKLAPGASPKDVGDKVVGLWATQRVAGNTQAAVGGLGPFTQQVENAAATTNFAAGIPSPLSGIAGALSAFFAVVSDGKMWRSLGWIVAGIVLMIIGVALWIGPSAARATPYGAAAKALD